ncbi:hypothetical protein [Nocardia brasiliensis]|uniref:hypothetical protein n=1 Tax=Nocardia brasiliensis TaxID=37326 RepID=UPI002454DE0F|nr:hypothetical protein [Nocardia brasiliensis]
MKRAAMLLAAVAGISVPVVSMAGGATMTPTAAAYPVGPWGVDGCNGKAPDQCPFSPSEDGLTWAWHGDAWNYDKTGAFVCMSSQFWCNPVMSVVRALPPTPIGSWIHPS